MPPFISDESILTLMNFALTLPPGDSKLYSRNPNPVRDFLLDLADCVRVGKEVARERKSALERGKPATKQP